MFAFQDSMSVKGIIISLWTPPEIGNTTEEVINFENLQAHD